MATIIESESNQLDSNLSPNDKIYVRNKSIIIKNDNPYASIDDVNSNDHHLHIENLVDAVLISEIDLVDKIINHLLAIE